MNLRKWKSNLQLLNGCDTSQSSLDLNIGGLESTKTLGLGWQAMSDELCFPISDSVIDSNSKREMLSVISQIFDPLGLLSPCVMTMKMLLQKLWLHKLSWDEQLPPEVNKLWSELIVDLPELNKIRIPRRVIIDSYKYLEFHIFCDASERAIAFSNINDLLVRGGDCLLVFLGHMPVFDVYRLLARSTRWSFWLKDVDRYVSPYHDCQDPEKDIKRMMTTIGFKNVEVKCVQKLFVYTSVEAVKRNSPNYQIPAASLGSDVSEAKSCAVYDGLNQQEPSIKLLYVTPEKIQSSPKFQETLARLYEKGKISSNIAKESGVAPWTLYPQMALRDMAEKLPETAEAMLKIPHVTNANYKKYGFRLLPITFKYFMERIKIEMTLQDQGISEAYEDEEPTAGPSTDSPQRSFRNNKSYRPRKSKPYKAGVKKTSRNSTPTNPDLMEKYIINNG
ncbi:unnamed protein product [Danaus chrysippus]|uniref:(African queen) hypothetical protein n=1 Tax=Danaus chrysippus TaxID=151541 RepID=A0A8J2R6H5_9NEOP|nr:unnamed protein product [Danaus chrysippus]